MTPIEKEWRRISASVGCTLLIFSVLLLLKSAILTIAPLFTLSLSAQAAEIAEELLGAVLYALSFTLPLLFFKMITRGYVHPPLRLSPELTGEGLCCALFGVCATMALAFVNAKLVSKSSGNYSFC